MAPARNEYSMEIRILKTSDNEVSIKNQPVEFIYIPGKHEVQVVEPANSRSVCKPKACFTLANCTKWHGLLSCSHVSLSRLDKADDSLITRWLTFFRKN